jgi:hypothetical protein
MSEKCKLICMSFDGDYVTDHPRGQDVFECVKDAWEWENDMGSRWFFYPFRFVVTASGETVKDAPDELFWLKGKLVKTIVKLFENTSELPEAAGVECDEFISLLWSTM